MGVLEGLKAKVGLGDAASGSALPTSTPPPPPPAAAAAGGGIMGSLKSKMGLAPEPAPPAPAPLRMMQSAAAKLEEAAPRLSWQQRAIGFGVCLAAGLLMSFLVRWRDKGAQQLAMGACDQ